MKFLKPVESVFKLESYLIEDAQFQIKEASSRVKYSLKLLPNFGDIEHGDGHLLSEVVLELQVTGRVGRRVVHKVRVKIKGIFRMEGHDLDEELFKTLARLNGVMNLLLIVRSYIASTTAQMGIRPIVIPLVDLLATKIRSE